MHEVLIGGTCALIGFGSGMWFQTKVLAYRARRAVRREHH